MNITVIGGGKMGLPIACQFATSGGNVTVCDTNASLVETINAGVCPFEEPGLAEKLHSAINSATLKASTNCVQSVKEANVVIVIVPVLLTANFEADTRIIESVTDDIARGLQPGSMVVYETTLPVGTTRRLARLLEGGGLKAGVDFDLVFSPERVKSRQLFDRLTQNPKVVGGLTEQAELRAADFHQRYLGAPVIRVGSLEAAEMVKLSGMIYRDVNIALANELAFYCESLGLDAVSIFNAANTDEETALLFPGIGVGGHCTPVYPHFLLRDAERRGIPVSLTELGRLSNDAQPANVVNQIERVWQPLRGKQVTILGLAFRPGVKESQCSPAFRLKQELSLRGAIVGLHDPLYSDDEIRLAGFTPATVDGASVLVLNTAHEQYRQLDFNALKAKGLELFVDGRNYFDVKSIRQAGVSYLGIGRGFSDVPHGGAEPLPEQVDASAPIALTKLNLSGRESAAVARVIRSGWIMQGPETERFESEFADYVQAPFACAVSSGTAALLLALRALGVENGDEVITVSHSFIATANSIVLSGAIPVFADIEPHTLNIDPKKIEALISPRTKAILCVHQLGLPCDLNAIVAIAKKHGLRVIEDAACALGSEIMFEGDFEKIGKPIGDVACFSFHPRKIVSTGDGGMLTTRSSELDARFRLLRNHGMSLSTLQRQSGAAYKREQYLEPAYNYRLTDLQAAVGREQLARLPNVLEGRRATAESYQRLLSNINGVTLLSVPPFARTNWQSYAIRLSDGAPAAISIIDHLQAQGIACRPGITCAHSEPAYQQVNWRCAGGLSACTCAGESCRYLVESERAQKQTIILPMHSGLTATDLDRIARALASACSACSLP